MNKNKFLTFIMSIIPGCGLMYLGYMKKGLQVMLLFATSCFMAYFVAYLRYFEWIMAIFIFLLPVIWFYQMFDSMHTVSRMQREGIEVPSDDGFYVPQKAGMLSPAITKIVAVIFILAGSFGIIFGFLDNAYYLFHYETAEIIVRTIRHYLIPAIVSIALIIAGIKLLRGSKPMKTDDMKAAEGSDSL